MQLRADARKRRRFRRGAAGGRRRRRRQVSTIHLVRTAGAGRPGAEGAKLVSGLWPHHGGVRVEGRAGCWHRASRAHETAREEPFMHHRAWGRTRPGCRAADGLWVQQIRWHPVCTTTRTAPGRGRQRRACMGQLAGGACRQTCGPPRRSGRRARATEHLIRALCQCAGRGRFGFSRHRGRGRARRLGWARAWCCGARCRGRSRPPYAPPRVTRARGLSAADDARAAGRPEPRQLQQRSPHRWQVSQGHTSRALAQRRPPDTSPFKVGLTRARAGVVVERAPPRVHAHTPPSPALSYRPRGATSLPPSRPGPKPGGVVRGWTLRRWSGPAPRTGAH